MATRNHSTLLLEQVEAEATRSREQAATARKREKSFQRLLTSASSQLANIPPETVQVILVDRTRVAEEEAANLLDQLVHSEARVSELTAQVEAAERAKTQAMADTEAAQRAAAAARTALVEQAQSPMNREFSPDDSLADIEDVEELRRLIRQEMRRREVATKEYASRLSSLETRLLETQDGTPVTQEEVQSLQQKLSVVEQEKRAAEREVAKMRTECDEVLERQRAAIEAQTEVMDARFARLEATMHSKIATLKAEGAGDKAEAADLRRRLLHSEEQVTTLRRQKEEAVDKAEGLSRKLEASAGQVASLKSSLDAVQAKINKTDEWDEEASVWNQLRRQSERIKALSNDAPRSARQYKSPRREGPSPSRAVADDMMLWSPPPESPSIVEASLHLNLSTLQETKEQLADKGSEGGEDSDDEELLRGGDLVIPSAHMVAPTETPKRPSGIPSLGIAQAQRVQIATLKLAERVEGASQKPQPQPQQQPQPQPQPHKQPHVPTVPISAIPVARPSTSPRVWGSVGMQPSGTRGGHSNNQSVGRGTHSTRPTTAAAAHATPSRQPATGRGRGATAQQPPRSRIPVAKPANPSDSRTIRT
mmetsp:Transcript_25629/g.55534  ORF Transcript_25629/g.55534 Transcript_25629/m.55534 type:complete len:594 (-) Transcript_25629:49-1830(-)